MERNQESQRNNRQDVQLKRDYQTPELYVYPGLQTLTGGGDPSKSD